MKNLAWVRLKVGQDVGLKDTIENERMVDQKLE